MATYALLLSLAYAPSAQPAQCGHAPYRAGTDFNDRNITVLTGASAATAAACCSACAAYNAKSGNNTCGIGVWHNLSPPSCVLKYSANMPVPGNRVIGFIPPPQPLTFRFANTQSSGMVLQSAPQHSRVWGFCPDGDSVKVTFDGTTIDATIEPGVPNPAGGGSSTVTIWTAVLPATPASYTQHTITATSAKTIRTYNTLKLEDVLFGDVWVCSGQSNMAYSLEGANGVGIVHPPVNNSAVEIADMVHWPHIRMLRTGRAPSSSPQLELLPADTVTGGSAGAAVVGWSQPCPDILNGKCRADFSNICWFYGRNIQKQLDIPIGLIGTYVGGTPDEAWSSQDALEKCGVVSPNLQQQDTKGVEVDGERAAGDDQQHGTQSAPNVELRGTVKEPHSALWNGMVAPLLRSTIKGAVWYQGESDASHPGGARDGYNCTFPAMIADWRSKWSASTNGLTNATFPFGFVQLNSVGNASAYTNVTDPSNGDPYQPSPYGYAGLRWSQSAGYGYTPNPKMPNVFMAVCYDTPDVPHPNRTRDPNGFNVHSPFKQPAAARLARAGLQVAYGIDTFGTFAPFFDSLDRGHGANVVTLTVGNITGGSEVRLHGTQGFEVLVPASEHVPNPASSALGPAPAASEMIWLSVAITGHNTTSVTVSGVPKSATKIRYNWWSNPCGEDCFKCGVYVTVTPIGTLSGELDFLPLPPYFASLPYPRR